MSISRSGFDTLQKERMTKKEEQKVKLAAKHLLKRLLKGAPKSASARLVEGWSDTPAGKKCCRRGSG